MRAHIILDEKLVEEIDELAGKRRRSAFIEDAIRTKLARERLHQAMQNARGSLDFSKYPEWDSPRSVSDWVSRLRKDDEQLIDSLEPNARRRESSS